MRLNSRNNTWGSARSSLTRLAAALGEKIFRDASLSASGSMSCATCHDPARGHASLFSTPVVFGGPALDQPGLRTAPSIRYLRFNDAFHFAPDGTPTGGFFWDGRANSLAEQAKGPFLNAAEMANPDVASVIAKLAATSYAGEFRAVFGAGSTDLATRPDLCGAFKVPSLRNVALRQRYFHNGQFSSLEEVIRFYVQRDTNAERWYPLDALGNPIRYNDLPESLRGNVNVTESPYNRQPGAAPALNDDEIRDVAAFLRTLTDGYVP